MRRSLIASAAMLMLAACAGQLLESGPSAAVTPPVRVELMRDVVKELSADTFEGRAPGSATEPAVLDAIIARFRAAGLQPGNHGEWLQEVPIVEITARNHTPLTLAGSAAPGPLTFRFGTDFVAASHRLVPRSELADSELVFVGYGINAPELGWNDYAGVDMTGKTALILVNDPDYAAATEDGLFKGRRMTYYGRWTYKFEEAARQGAAAALIVHDSFPAGYGWSVVQSSWSGAQHFVRSDDGNRDQTIANGWVQKRVAEAVLKAAGKDLATLSDAAGRNGFRAVPLGLRASLGFDNTLRESRSSNVVGILPGQQRPDEYVLYTAHWDHLGRCTPDASGDDICNGAVDNATGIAALAAIAEANAEAGPTARSQVFLAVTLEESGLLGSEYYAANPVYPLSRTVGGVNIDALHPGGRAHDYALIGGDKSQLTTLFRRALAEQGLVEAPESNPERGYYYRSDHFSFARKGVPMFNIARGEDLVIGGRAAGAAAQQDYTDNRYHAPGDEYSEDWDWSGITADVTLFLRLGRMLADSEEWPNWHKDDEFRAIRDRSRSGQ